MEIHQLRYFVAAAEAQSVTAAAQRVHLSQPALSRQIRALEDEIGVPLFRRHRQRIHLTDAGRFFLDRARQILCDLETSVQQTREHFGGKTRTIRLGFLNIFLDDLVAPAVRLLKKSHPAAGLSLFELSPHAQLERLRQGELDLAVLGNLEEADRVDFQIVSLASSAMAAVLPEDHRLAGRKQIDLRELAGEGFVSLSDSAYPGRRRFLAGICRLRDFEPRIAEESDSLPLLLVAVAGGAGVALLPEHSRKLPHTGCVFVRLKTPVVHAEIMAVFRHGTNQGALGALIGHLAEVARKIA